MKFLKSDREIFTKILKFYEISTFTQLTFQHICFNIGYVHFQIEQIESDKTLHSESSDEGGADNEEGPQDENDDIDEVDNVFGVRKYSFEKKIFNETDIVTGEGSGNK